MAAQQRLAEYFSSKQSNALEAYAQFATGTAWLVEHKMELYCSAQVAFAKDADAKQAIESFEKVYDVLSSTWQVFRPVGAKNCWDATKLFTELNGRMDLFSRSSGINLKNFNEKKCRNELVAVVRPLGDVKKQTGFPLMTVSKFLHFYNPSLFPIYDGAVMEQKVFKRFEQEYCEYCDRSGLDDNALGEEFLGNYLCFGSALLSQAGPNFMENFVAWLQDEIAPRRFREYKSLDLRLLHATAVEFTLIGAWQAETT